MNSWPQAPLTTVRAGIVANPHAGLGPEVVRSTVRCVAEAIAQAVPNWRVIALRDSFAADPAAGGPWIRTIAGSATTSAADATANALIAGGVDLLIGIGGDGTLADIAAAIVHSGQAIPLLGVGIGSSNVGPLVSVRGEAVSSAWFRSLAVHGVHGIEAFRSAASLGFAFNDAVFSNLYFGTRDGKRVDLDAAAHLRGDDRSIEPSSVCLETTYVEKNGRTVLDGKRHRLAQIVASPLNEPRVFAGKAVSGLMSWGPYLGRPAVVAGLSEVAIRTRIDDELLAVVEPLHLYHVCFGAADTIAVGGLDPAAVVVLDGNPVLHMERAERVELKLRPDLLRVLRAVGSPPRETAKSLGCCCDGSSFGSVRSC